MAGSEDENQETVEDITPEMGELQKELETDSLPASLGTSTASEPTLVRLRLSGLDLDPCVLIPNKNMQYHIIVSKSGVALRVNVLVSTGDTACDELLVKGLMQSEWRACPGTGTCEGIRTLEVRKH